MGALGFLRSGSMKGEKSAAASSRSLSSWALFAVRFLQFVMGVTVIGLYAVDLAAAGRAGKYMDAKWVYAVFCGTISAVLALVYALPFLKSWFLFALDGLVWFFWLVLFGIFGKMYISENPEGNKGIIRMKHAVWIDLVNLLLWFGTALWGAFVFWKARKHRPSAASTV